MKTSLKISRPKPEKQIRYAVVGLGDIAQEAVLPAFKKAKNSVCQALVSSNPAKLRALGKAYRVANLCRYDDYEALLESSAIDAVYIALPNTLHADYSIRAARAGVHVLCEKPMATTTQSCVAVIDACRTSKVKLMIAYRLHFERANLEALKIVRSGQIGDPILFSSMFGFTVRPDNIRLDSSLGGGPLYDIGIYCINAARSIFGEEPREVSAFSEVSKLRKFKDVQESVSALMRFSRGQVAQFSCSFGSAPVDQFTIVGTKGLLSVESAFDWNTEKILNLEVQGRTQRRVIQKSGQFAAELDYFSDCILKNKTPEPSGWEGFADIQVIEAIEESIKTRHAVTIERKIKTRHPSVGQMLKRPASKIPKLVEAENPAEEAA